MARFTARRINGITISHIKEKFTMNSQGFRQKFKCIIGIAVLFLFTALPTVSQENIRIPQKQIRVQVVSANGMPLTNTHIRVQLLHTDLDGSGWGNSPGTKQTDAEGFFVADLRDDEPHIYILGVECRGYLAKTDPFIIDEKQLQAPLLLTLNGDPTQDTGRTSDQAYAALERFLHTPAVWVVNPANGHAYKRIYCEDITDAITQAAVENAYVIALNDRGEEVWIKNAFRHELFWIGLSDAAEEGKWSWHSGEPLEYINWEEKYHTAEGGNTETKDYVIVGFTGRWESVEVDNDGETYTAFLERENLPVKIPSSTERDMDVQAMHPWQILYADETHPWSVIVVNPENGHAYKRIRARSLADARAKADADDAYLVTINNAAEQKWLSGVFGNGLYWIGLSDAETEGQWQWDNGKPLTYTNWGPEDKFPRSALSAAEKDGVVMTFINGTWHAVGPGDLFWNATGQAILETDNFPIKIPAKNK